ncbi:MAG: ATP synthase F1 subunit gamma [Clostridiales bacterium]|nr:MAG: ATP synthase F1 subunit gamma [Clostridiales bacterium]
MQNTNEIRRHITAVQQTRKITNAMKLVSTARIKKAMQNLTYNNLYFERVQSAMKDILLSPHPVDHPYLSLSWGKKRAYIVISGDKGMVGDHNAKLLDFAYSEISAAGDVILITIGIVGSEYFKKKGMKPDIEIAGVSQNPSLDNARNLVLDLMDLFDNSEARSVYLIFTTFDNKSTPNPVVRRILPIRIHDYENIQTVEPVHEILYIPSPEEVFYDLVPQYLVGFLFEAMVQAYASEHYARMNAMQSATDNADDLLKKLTLDYNRARQAAITQEISEITHKVDEA